MAKESNKKAGKKKTAKEEEVKAKAASEAAAEEESSSEEESGDSSEESGESESEATSEPAKEKEAAAKGHGDHGHGGHALAHASPHDHKPNRKEYWVIFGVLFALTILEVIVAQVPGIAKTSLVLALVMLALVKAICVALFYMHLKHETKFLKITVAIPLAMPALYAVVLIAEAMWRML